MRPDQAAMVSGMIASRIDFARIRMEINLNRETYNELEARHVPKEEVLVTFEIPYEGICMPTFYGQICKTLNEKQKVVEQETVEKKNVVEIQPRQQWSVLSVLKLRKVLFG
ncbi:MAG: hypothetical protein WC503_02175 [Candidatus Shapirobacteria bacterium]